MKPDNEYEKAWSTFYGGIFYFFIELKRRNKVLFYLGGFFFFLFLCFLIALQLCHYSLAEICHWLRPGKFTLSFAIFVATMGWFLEYLKEFWSKKKITCISWLIVILSISQLLTLFADTWLDTSNYYRMQLSDELIHKLSKKFFIVANITITTLSLLTLYIGIQFFRPLKLKPLSYLWGIRGGFIVFILSTFLGGYLLGRDGQMPPDPNDYGIPFLQLSSNRDILVSLHFLGIHYLQLLPLISYFFNQYLKKEAIISAVGIYFVVCLFFIY